MPFVSTVSNLLRSILKVCNPWHFCTVWKVLSHSLNHQTLLLLLKITVAQFLRRDRRYTIKETTWRSRCEADSVIRRPVFASLPMLQSLELHTLSQLLFPLDFIVKLTHDPEGGGGNDFANLRVAIWLLLMKTMEIQYCKSTLYCSAKNGVSIRLSSS